MSKRGTNNLARQGRRHNPLEQDILATGILRQKATKRKSQDLEEDGGNDFVECMNRAFLKVEFGATPRPTVLSYSLLYVMEPDT